MSLGGVGFSPALRTAIDAAINDGLLVLAAAGNEVGFVVAPANYREVIAVAATNIQDKPWSGSSHGPAVDVSAPGESVHAARTKREPNGVIYYTSRGSGTSFAVALTAGVAALWLAYHGRDELIATYGKPNLQAVFTDLLRRTARRPAGWNASQYGAGIVDAEALLAAPLPATAPAAVVAAVPAAPQSLSAAQRLAPFMPDQSESTAEASLNALLPGVPDADLYAGELAYHLTQDPQIRAAVTAAAAPAGAAAGLSDHRLGLARLRAAGSPSLAAALAED
jgi:subtilisin family serine protease